MAKEHLFDYDIYNFCFVYDYFKSQEINKTFSFISVPKVDVVFNTSINTEKTTHYRLESKKNEKNTYSFSFKVNQHHGEINQNGEYTRFFSSNYGESAIFNEIPFREAS